MTIATLLLIGSLICFCLATLNINGSRVSTGWLGAALFMFWFLIYSTGVLHR